ncbi:hypothetical protein [Jannaschia aquimarina]|uniref:Uncharacterized protein n=1 Tax=Jannaschia aquimarina TaxID=935700 RepID=A0A0D1DD44_9RHOB|nr:hypothetical protein [Jannaschia aquimarina]KIT17908.1 hypothetical protein jaqu_03330 [Jannaschia aquimarina]SNT23561.1 hypothetical protein SAMN05421775_108131 [Jannaschia aquimarina]
MIRLVIGSFVACALAAGGAIALVGGHEARTARPDAHLPAALPLDSGTATAIHTPLQTPASPAPADRASDIPLPALGDAPVEMDTATQVPALRPVARPDGPEVAAVKSGLVVQDLETELSTRSIDERTGGSQFVVPGPVPGEAILAQPRLQQPWATGVFR